jgi:3'-phosphoadenosine 5'-phosphosulfate sulfotransferase (PAPS reductase)/FAD synthetase
VLTTDLGAIHAQSAVFQSKLIAALALVQHALSQCERPYIAFSSGKDSVALTALVHRLNPDVPLVWSDDELELPETVTYMDALRQLAGPQLTITHGVARHAGWFDPWTQRPFWRAPLTGTRRVDQDVDDWQAGRGYDLTFTGLRMDENRRRRAWLAHAGPLYRVRAGTGQRCTPLWEWSADDVWALIAVWGLAYNPAYDRMEALHIPRHAQRIGPLPLARRAHLADGWPALLAQLEARYGPRWS